MKILLTVLFVISAATAFAQRINVQGTVSDSIKTPIPFANVVAFEMDSTQQNPTKIASIGVTDGKGSFLLKLNAEKIYWVEASYIGYKKWQKKIILNQLEMPLKIVLTEEAAILGEVEIVEEMPITISGDTISYKVDKFTKGTERKLEDVLDALPGFETTKDGEVKFQGKKVDKLMVEGKKFFDGSTKMATKNIPAKVVDKVQLLQNYTEASPMKKVGKEGSLAINISLREDSKQMAFGDVSAAGGYKNRYNTHASAFYYAPKTAINAIVDANNIGKPAFTFNDYINFTGGFTSQLSSNGIKSSPNWGNVEFATANAQNTTKLQSEMVSLNATQQVSKALQLSVYGIGAFNNIERENRSERQLLLSNNRLAETLDTRRKGNLQTGLGRIEATYAPNANFYLQAKTFAKAGSLDGRQNNISVTEEEEQTTNSREQNRNVMLKQSLQLYYSPDKFNLLALEGEIGYQKRDNSLGLEATSPLFEEILSPNLFQLNQQTNIEQRDLRFRTDYFRMLSPKTHVNVLVGGERNADFLSAPLTIEQEQQNNPSTTFNLNDIYGGLGFKTIKGGVLVQGQAVVHQFNYGTDSLPQQKGSFFAPSAKFRYTINKAQKITFSYKKRMQFLGVEQFAPITRIVGFNTIRQGNLGLQNALMHEFSLNHYWFSLFNGFNWYSGLSYQRKIADINNAVSPFGNERLLTTFNLGQAVFSNFAYTQLEKKWNTFKVKLGANVQQFGGFTLLEGIEVPNRTLSQQYQSSFSSTFFGKLYCTIGTNLQFNNYENGEIISRFKTINPFTELSLELFNVLELELDYAFFDYNGEDRLSESQYDFMEMRMQYQKPKSPWKFWLQGQNLTNTTSLRNDSTTANLISTNQQLVLPRMILLGVEFGF